MWTQINTISYTNSATNTTSTSVVVILIILSQRHCYYLHQVG